MTYPECLRDMYTGEVFAHELMLIAKNDRERCRGSHATGDGD